MCFLNVPSGFYACRPLQRVYLTLNLKRRILSRTHCRRRLYTYRNLRSGRQNNLDETSERFCGPKDIVLGEMFKPSRIVVRVFNLRFQPKRRRVLYTLFMTYSPVLHGT